MDIETIRRLNRNKAQLIAAYSESREHGNDPDTAVTLLADRIGEEAAAEIVAVMILLKGEWDARISPASRRWAIATAGLLALSLAKSRSLYYCDEIHPAHIDQLSAALRRMS